MVPDFIQKNIDISLYSAYKTPAKAKYFFCVENVEDMSKLSEIYNFAQENNLPILFIGSGTNCLFAFDIYEGIVIQNHLLGHSITETDSGRILEVSSGELVHPLACEVFDIYSIYTLIPWAGLPGTFGGAIIGNAGCFGLETKDFLIDAEVYFLKEWKQRTLSNKDFEYIYRGSKYKNTQEVFILSARFNLDIPQNEYMEWYTPESLRSLRRSKQPPGISCGSFFKNPVGNSAGALIDKAGLKGYTVGCIKVSEQHGNFLTASLPSRYQDVLKLRDAIKEKILNDFWIELEEEVKIITNRI